MFSLAPAPAATASAASDFSEVSISPPLAASWIWARDSDGLETYAVRLFRGRFTLATAGPVTVRVSADCRYELSLDGAWIARGPARALPARYTLDAWTLALPSGPHVLAARVVRYADEHAPWAELHARGAFLCEVRDVAGDAVVATGHSKTAWKTRADTSRSPIKVPLTLGGWFIAGSAERFDAALYPAGWETPAHDDSAWTDAVALAPEACPWNLRPRDLPAPRHLPDSFVSDLSLPLRISAGESRTVHLRAAPYAIGFPRLRWRAAAGARITLAYSERDPLAEPAAPYFADELVHSQSLAPGAGSSANTWSPVHWRAFRHVTLTLDAGPHGPLHLDAFDFVRTGYPWRIAARFDAGPHADQLPALLRADLDTLAACTDETFMDCPFYEQLQYFGDARLQALTSLVISGDTRLARQAILQGLWSQRADGMINRSPPCLDPKPIATFALLWILMIEDYLRHAPDGLALAAHCLPGAERALAWFDARIGEDGLVNHLREWGFIDWVPTWAMGEPPSFGPSAFWCRPEEEIARQRPSACVNLQLLAARQAVTRIARALGHTAHADALQTRADTFQHLVHATFWDESRGLYREAPDGSAGFNQHAQAWAILTDTVPAAQRDALAARLDDGDGLDPASLYGAFYVVEALARAGRLQNLWTHHLARWREALDRGLDTFPENPQPESRSLCHAWSAWLHYALLTHVLGARPTAPGGRDWVCEPLRVAGWDSAAGAVVTPEGLLDVAVDWRAGHAVVTRNLRSSPIAQDHP